MIVAAAFFAAGATASTFAPELALDIGGVAQFLALMSLAWMWRERP